MELTCELKHFLHETANSLTGANRRQFMARAVQLLGRGGCRRAERELGWNRGTIRKGLHEVNSGITCLDAYNARGRMRAEEQHPHLLDDLGDIVDKQSQTDPTFHSCRLYTRLSVAVVREQLIEQKGYDADWLPCEETLRVKLNQLGYHLQSVQKTQPLKRIPETEAIFEQLHQVNAEADGNENTLRISMDAKATVLLGHLSRGGSTRVLVKALDHDFRPEDTVTPFGLFLPHEDELHLYFATSRLTSDFIVDCLQDFWHTVQTRFPHVQRLVLNQDNGPECQSRRSQFIKRITDFADETQLVIDLAYYPPYHSKYNPIERVWGILEKHWNGSLLDTLETVLRFASSMTWKGISPRVKTVQKLYHKGVKLYHKGVKLSKQAMQRLETRLKRLPGLEKCFVNIQPSTP